MADPVFLKIILVILFVACVLIAECLVNSYAMTIKGHFLVVESKLCELGLRLELLDNLIQIISAWVPPVVTLSLLVEKEEEYENTEQE